MTTAIEVRGKPLAGYSLAFAVAASVWFRWNQGQAIRANEDGKEQWR